jgi:hypothetical protein
VRLVTFSHVENAPQSIFEEDIPIGSDEQEIVIFVGFPACGMWGGNAVSRLLSVVIGQLHSPDNCPHYISDSVPFPSLLPSGKSSFFEQHFRPRGYARVNRDTLKTNPRCVKFTKESIERGQFLALAVLLLSGSCPISG